jgi:alkylated DNA repair dioxygenase AlkB
MHPRDLFPAEYATPIGGLQYFADFLSRAEEEALVREIAELPLKPAPYKQYLSRRRIAAFGSEYDFSSRILRAGPPVPAFLFSLRTRIADWAGIEEERFVHALATEYEEGTPLGWHRDTPEFGLIVGVSLGGAARMRWRRYPPGRGERVFDLELEPRSVYCMRDEARWEWQHSIAATPALRYSITFRTLR